MSASTISFLVSSCHYHVHNLHCIRYIIHFNAASIIATSLFDSRLDYCNSLCFSLSITQLKTPPTNSKCIGLSHHQKSYSRSHTHTHHSCTQITSLHTNTKSYLVLTISFIILSQPICVILSMSNLIVELVPLTTYVSAFHSSSPSLS